MAETLKVDDLKPSVIQHVANPTNPELQAQSQPSPVNDAKDTVNGFLDKIALAHAQQWDYVEVSPEVFDHYMRGQKTPYFYYQNVRVYKYGDREKVELAESGMA